MAGSSDIGSVAPRVVVMLHTLLVGATAIYVESSARAGYGYEAGMLWNVFVVVDFPIGLICIPLETALVSSLGSSFSPFTHFVALPAIAFGILGECNTIG